MNKFIKPEQLNVSQLFQELKAVGVLTPVNSFAEIDEDGNFWLPVKDKDVAKAEPVVAAHVGIDASIEFEARRQAILDKLGLTADEVTALLA
jgi:hypothetical protein